MKTTYRVPELHERLYRIYDRPRQTWPRLCTNTSNARATRHCSYGNDRKAWRCRDSALHNEKTRYTPGNYCRAFSRVSSVCRQVNADRRTRTSSVTDMSTEWAAVHFWTFFSTNDCTPCQNRFCESCHSAGLRFGKSSV